ncbi:PhzF family phenazine biosynthesis isomerase [Sneathiella chungangensis]|uniref:PhzF family phenazine biosynthesis isomerase n=1 Tax=Sneathiella chungangensis TaxID=1418234 RepID=A0A845MGG2_9PROT|nr:PhzF family phenazine biosynthesis protein [Sneathiella chungangensis]MZR22755.1 PhzF family phenazine biosynthesis isomerase [Sneathiella chungangensis]
MSEIHAVSSIINAQIVNGFVRGQEGGNPAGVVLDADNLTEADMLNIAGKIGLSETAFVSRSKTEGFKLDFFTPNRRIAHCGHATIATFSYLAEIGLVADGLTSKETVDGPRKIIIKEGAAYMEQLAPRYRQSSDWTEEGVSAEDILKSLNLAPQDLDQRIDPVLVNTGNSFVVIAVKDRQVLHNIQPDFDAITRISDKLDLIGYYVFTTDVGSQEIDATTRMFAPRYAIEEESATGMAAGPLACVLFDYLGLEKEKIVIGQGSFMAPPSPSLITVELILDNGKIAGLMAGGYGKVMKKMEIEI